ncbi:MAG: nitrilase-related carbon-nitrogen hydrolase, partial [Gallionellaceae bacterium]
MKIAIAQINCTVGDLAGNAAKIADYARRAKAQGAEILLTPELSLCGYPPEDLLLRDGFYRACDLALFDLAQQVQGITLLVGHPHLVDGERFNAASILRDGKIVATYHKHALPNHSVFDEERYFAHGSEPCLIEMDGVKFGINICADVWHEQAAIRAKEAGAQILLVLNASPYHFNKQVTRYDTIRERIGDTGLAVVYANMVGGQDELVFDGASFVMDNSGKLTHQFSAFDEVLGFVEVKDGKLVPGECAKVEKDAASIYRALCLGVRDYITKNRFPGVLLGLSGGIDSALTPAVA